MKGILKRIIPACYHWKLYNWLNDHFIGWRSRFYSCFGEDTIVNCILSGKENGFYVDVGAFHPDKYSNTKFFYRYRGWRGINIEPNPFNIKLFRRKRKKDINLNLGISERKDSLSYYVFEDGLYNTFSSKCKGECESRGHICKEVVQIEVTPLDKILDIHLPPGQKIDLLDVDVEEFDLAVLKSNNWEKYRPSVIIVEDHQFSFESPEKSEIYHFLIDRSYRLHSVCQYSLIFKCVEG